MYIHITVLCVYAGDNTLQPSLPSLIPSFPAFSNYKLMCHRKMES